ncbi:hypothetical protein N7528_008399 [Penicillium herquei]|nr:hypothetical protein N7528_008399 [Penicillium herquei]
MDREGSASLFESAAAAIIPPYITPLASLDEINGNKNMAWIEQDGNWSRPFDCHDRLFQLLGGIGAEIDVNIG